MPKRENTLDIKKMLLTKEFEVDGINTTNDKKFLFFFWIEISEI
jgi:hypothetical protein